MLVRYLGHSSFLIFSSKGSSIVTDPYGTNIGYTFPVISADVILVSHEHQDHNATWRVGGNPVVVKRTSEFPVEHEVNVEKFKEKILFRGIPSFHDKYQGRRKGPNTIWVWHMEGVRYVYLGDLGHILTDKQVQEIGGDADVLFLPVGGGTTLSPMEAALVINQLTPKLVFPMHYKTNVTEFAGVTSEVLETFLNKTDSVENTYSMAYDIDLARLPSKTKIIVLKYE